MSDEKDRRIADLQARISRQQQPINARAEKSYREGYEDAYREMEIPDLSKADIEESLQCAWIDSNSRRGKS